MRKHVSMRWQRAVPDDCMFSVECDTLLAMRDACVTGLGRTVFPCFFAINDARLDRLGRVEEGTPLWVFVATCQQGKQRRFVGRLVRALLAEKGDWQ